MSKRKLRNLIALSLLCFYAFFVLSSLFYTPPSRNYDLEEITKLQSKDKVVNQIKILDIPQDDSEISFEIPDDIYIESIFEMFKYKQLSMQRQMIQSLVKKIQSKQFKFNKILFRKKYEQLQKMLQFNLRLIHIKLKISKIQKQINYKLSAIKEYLQNTIQQRQRINVSSIKQDFEFKLERARSKIQGMLNGNYNQQSILSIEKELSIKLKSIKGYLQTKKQEKQRKSICSLKRLVEYSLIKNNRKLNQIKIQKIQILQEKAQRQILNVKKIRNQKIQYKLKKIHRKIEKSLKQKISNFQRSKIIFFLEQIQDKITSLRESLLKIYQKKQLMLMIQIIYSQLKEPQTKVQRYLQIEQNKLILSRMENILHSKIENLRLYIQKIISEKQTHQILELLSQIQQKKFDLKMLFQKGQVAKLHKIIFLKLNFLRAETQKIHKRIQLNTIKEQIEGILRNSRYHIFRHFEKLSLRKLYSNLYKKCLKTKHLIDLKIQERLIQLKIKFYLLVEKKQQPIVIILKIILTLGIFYQIGSLFSTQPQSIQKTQHSSLKEINSINNIRETILSRSKRFKRNKQISQFKETLLQLNITLDCIFKQQNSLVENILNYQHKFHDTFQKTIERVQDSDHSLEK